MEDMITSDKVQQKKNISRRKELYTEEGRQYYKGNLWIPDDLETYKL